MLKLLDMAYLFLIDERIVTKYIPQLLFFCGEERQWTAGDINWEELRQIRHRGTRIGTCGWILARTHEA